MGIIRTVRNVPVAALIAAAGLLTVAGVVMASGGTGPIEVCVAVKEGKPIVTPKAGACKTGYTLHEVGKEGPAGAQGEPGPAGPSGTSIVDRTAVSEPVSSNREAVPIPLSGASWSQASDEVQQLVGQVSLLVPNRLECNTGEGAPARGSVQVLLDGTQIAEAATFNLSAGPTTLPLEWKSPGVASDWLLEPPASLTHTITAQASDNCQPGGPGSSHHFTVEALTVDVIGTH